MKVGALRALGGGSENITIQKINVQPYLGYGRNHCPAQFFTIIFPHSVPLSKFICPPLELFICSPLDLFHTKLALVTGSLRSSPTPALLLDRKVALISHLGRNGR